MLIIALMFGAMHFSIFRFPSTAIMGALISFFLLRGQSLFTCIIFHVAFNSIPVLVFISGADPEALEKNYFTETWQQATILFLSAIIVFFGLRFFPKTQAEG